MRWTNPQNMPDSPRERPFSPPSAPATSLWIKILVFLLALFVLYQGADWVLKQRTLITIRPAETSPAPQPPHSSQTPATEPFSVPQTSPQDDSASAPHIVKCVVNGKTSYGDGPCAQGAVSSQIKTRRDHNLMGAVRPQSVMNAAPTAEHRAPRSPVAQNSPAVDTAAFKKAECKALDVRIEQLDSMSRQPQGASTQDWIRGERKKARDRQFRLLCV